MCVCVCVCVCVRVRLSQPVIRCWGVLRWVPIQAAVYQNRQWHCETALRIDSGMGLHENMTWAPIMCVFLCEATVWVHCQASKIFKKKRSGEGWSRVRRYGDFAHMTAAQKSCSLHIMCPVWAVFKEEVSVGGQTGAVISLQARFDLSSQWQRGARSTVSHLPSTCSSLFLLLLPPTLSPSPLPLFAASSPQPL